MKTLLAMAIAAAILGALAVWAVMRRVDRIMAEYFGEDRHGNG